MADVEHRLNTTHTTVQSNGVMSVAYPPILNTKKLIIAHALLMLGMLSLLGGLALGGLTLGWSGQNEKNIIISFLFFSISPLFTVAMLLLMHELYRALRGSSWRQFVILVLWFIMVAFVPFTTLYFSVVFLDTVDPHAYVIDTWKERIFSVVDPNHDLLVLNFLVLLPLQLIAYGCALKMASRVKRFLVDPAQGKKLQNGFIIMICATLIAIFCVVGALLTSVSSITGF